MTGGHNCQFLTTKFDHDGQNRTCSHVQFVFCIKRESSVIWPPKFRTDDLNQCLRGNWQLWGSRYIFLEIMFLLISYHKV